MSGKTNNAWVEGYPIEVADKCQGPDTEVIHYFGKFMNYVLLQTFSFFSPEAFKHKLLFVQTDIND